MSDSFRENTVYMPPKQASPEGGLRLYAPAKINLSLRVGPRREDGFHAVDSLVAGITLYDQIDLHAREDGKITLACEGFPCGPAEDNLVYRAAKLLAEGRSVAGAEIRLVKNIPPGGGLGGGSSDAACTLAGLNDLWNLNLSNEALREPAGRLGSDVPMFLGPLPSRMTGRGEILEPIDVFAFWAALILPALNCSTRDVYRAFDALPAPRDEPLDSAILTQPPSQWRSRLVNHLAPAAFAVCPPLGELHGRLAKLLPAPVHLTGSGSSLFVLCDDRDEAERLVRAVPADLQKLCTIVRQNSWTDRGDSEKIRP